MVQKIIFIFKKNMCTFENFRVVSDLSLFFPAVLHTTTLLEF